MRTEFLQTLVLVSATSIGCGSGPITGEGDELGDESEGSDEGSDGSETGDGDGQGCMTAEGQLALAALRLDGASDRAWMIVSGGGEVELELTGPAFDAPFLVGANAGSRVAVARTVGVFGEEQQATLHVFDRSTGALAWSRELASAVSQLWIAEDGWIAGVTYVSQPGQLVGFAMNEDQTIMLADHQPLAAPSGGQLLAQETLEDFTYGAYGWVDLADQSWIPAEPPASPNYGAWVGEDGRTLEYMAGSLFVRASPEGSETFELPLDPMVVGHVTLVDSAGSFRLLQVTDVEGQSLGAVRVDVESGEAIVVDPTPLAGWAWFDCYARNAQIDADGTLLFELRDPAGARVWAFDPDDQQWSEVGLAIGRVDDIAVEGNFGDVHLVRSAAQFMTYCPPTEWNEPPADALVGDSMQLVRRSPALAMVLPIDAWSGQVTVDRGERCVAFSNADGWQVRALEGEAAVVFEASSATWQWLD